MMRNKSQRHNGCQRKMAKLGMVLVTVAPGCLTEICRMSDRNLLGRLSRLAFLDGDSIQL